MAAALPAKSVDSNRATSRIAEAALRERIVPHVHPCKVTPKSWCLSDPDDLLLSNDTYGGEHRNKQSKTPCKKQGGALLSRQKSRHLCVAYSSQPCLAKNRQSRRRAVVVFNRTFQLRSRRAGLVSTGEILEDLAARADDRRRAKKRSAKLQGQQLSCFRRSL